MKDKTYRCRDCDKEVREKAVTQTLVDLKLCPRCYTERAMKK